MNSLFISYAAEDSALAHAIARGLEAAGYSTWYYERDSYPGASYLSQILTALAAAGAVLIVLTPAALTSHQIDREIIQAHEADKPFVPVLDRLTYAELRERRREWAMAMGASVAVSVPPEGVAALLPRLVEGLRRVVGPPTTPAPTTPAPAAPASTTPVSTTPSAAAAPRDNLPSDVSSFVGREHARADVRTLLERTRLVTLRGPGGVGKTRLALQVAAAERARYPDGTWLIELAPLTESTLVVSKVAQTLGVREEPGGALDASTLVVSTVAQTLGVHEEPGRSLLDVLVAALRERALLLVLDNCEHLVVACAALTAALLRACPDVRVLATSREGLEVAGEQLYQVSPLSVPDPDHLPPLDRLAQFEAVRLFVERARARRPDFALDARNAAAVAAICRHLDGIPLALELAAARVGALPVEGIATRLDDRFRLLTGGPRTALPRQRTLRAALDWSYDLLSEPERALLRRLAVFAGGWTLGAAEAVGVGEGVEDWEALDLLDGLVNKSLAQEEESSGDARYSLLETVRQYGIEKLGEGGETAATRERHLEWYLALAEESEPGLLGPEQGAWLERLEREHDNLRVALVWARDNGLVERGLRLAGALWRFWSMRGYLTEGRERLEGLLTLDGDDNMGVMSARAKALNGAGVLAGQQGDYAHAVSLYEQSLTLCRGTGDKAAIAHVLNNLGLAAMYQGDHAHAAILLEQSLALRREQRDSWSIALSLQNLAGIAWERGELGRAATLLEESLAVRRTLGDEQGIAAMLANLGLVARDQGDYARATALSEEGLTLYRKMGNGLGVANVLSNMGSVALRQGDYARAGTLYKEGLGLFEMVGSKAIVAECLEGLACVVHARGLYERAARLGGAAEALRATIGIPLSLADRAAHDRVVNAVRTALGGVFASTWTEGKKMSVSQAIAYALAADAAGLKADAAGLKADTADSKADTADSKADAAGLKADAAAYDEDSTTLGGAVACLS